MITECKKCLINDNIKNISFNKEGVCIYCQEFNRNRKFFDKSNLYTSHKLKSISRQIRNKTKGEKYNCLIGLSGGVDSTYLVYLAKKMNLRVLLVHFDNGWNSVTALKNIYKIAKYTNYKLNTYVIDWEEFKSLQRSYIESGVIDVEMLTDHAISGTLIKIAKEKKIKFILSGENYSTENGMPRHWTWQKIDKTNITNINKHFENIEIKKFPIINYYNYIKILFFSKISFVKILNQINYEKLKSIEILKKKFGFIEYFNKHEESLFTKFYQSYYLPRRFNVDKRIAHMSALIRNNEITKEYAKKLINQPLEDEKLKKEIEFVCEKLNFDVKEMEEIVKQKTVDHKFYGSDLKYFSLLLKLKNFFKIKLYK